jgi:hypothetical protein
MSEFRVVEADLEASVDVEADGSVIVRLRGIADGVVVKELDSVLAAAHSRRMKSGHNPVVVDIRALEFMNSSCFKSFITWIVQVRRLAEHARYKIRFLSNPGLHWQKRSLHAFSHFGRELVEVVTA